MPTSLLQAGASVFSLRLITTWHPKLSRMTGLLMPIVPVGVFVMATFLGVWGGSLVMSLGESTEEGKGSKWKKRGYCEEGGEGERDSLIC